MTARSEGLCVFVRVRPPIFKEVKEDTAVIVGGSQSLTVNSENKEISCSYDHVFNEVSEQKSVFEKVQPLLVDVLSGINSCIFAYGQTSAGKSYTMIGPNGGQDILRCDREEWGILPRASEFLLGYLNEKSQEGLLTFEVKASFLQIYNENLYDLLRDSSSIIEDKVQADSKDSELKIREVPKPKSKSSVSKDLVSEVFVSGLSEFRVQTSEDILRILAVGTANRMTRSTDFNLTSSRSHAILQLTFEIESHLDSGQTLISRSKLNLVDLAGSEKIPFVNSDTNNARHMKELTSINKSLSALGNVISALSSNNRTHIPYRDSKLTRILQDSLSGNTRTILIACVAPTVLHTSESISTLQFADRAKNVMLTIKANTLVDDKVMLAKAQSEITRLKALLTHALKQLESKSLGDSYGGEVERLVSENEQLRKENASLKSTMNGNGHHNSNQYNSQYNNQYNSQYNGQQSTPGISPSKKKQGLVTPGSVSGRRSSRGKQLLDTKLLLEGLSRPSHSRRRPPPEKSSYEAFSDFSGKENSNEKAKPAFGRKKAAGAGAKGSRNGLHTDNSDSETHSLDNGYRKVRGKNGNAQALPHAGFDVLDSISAKQRRERENIDRERGREKESRVHSKLYKAINDRQVEELNQRLTNASHQVEEEERRELASDSISSLLGLPRRQEPLVLSMPPPQQVEKEPMHAAAVSPEELLEAHVSQPILRIESNSRNSTRPDFGVSSPAEKLSADDSLVLQSPPSAAADRYSGYTKITTPSVQKPESTQQPVAPSNRVFLSRKSGARVSSSGSQNSHQDNSGFLDPHNFAGRASGSNQGQRPVVQNSGTGNAAAMGNMSVGTSILAASSMVSAKQQAQTSQAEAQNHRAVNLSNSKDDIGTPVQMFSFRQNTWDRVDIIDYDDNKRLHKCRYQDGSIQWLDLSKKPIREYAA